MYEKRTIMIIILIKKKHTGLQVLSALSDMTTVNDAVFVFCDAWIMYHAVLN